MGHVTALQPVENGLNPRETQSMLLERIASEMNRLKFYIAHAQVSLSFELCFCIASPLSFELFFNMFSHNYLNDLV